MRLRIPAALALVTALLAPPMSALACDFECWPAPAEVAATRAVDLTPAEGSCHRADDEAAAGDFTLRAAPHDCSTHPPPMPRLTNPAAPAASNKASVVTVSPPSIHYALGVILENARSSRAPDPAPPDRTPDLSVPLRL